jgi:two-component system capsular synthesis sensor histidine kinase RcsC
LHGDRTRLVQIVKNLLSNAFKFTSSGKITLSARVDANLHERPVLTCRVLDSGIGMDSALVARIFNPFVQAEPSTSSRYGGTGLGLSICARLCELMGGQIRVESTSGLGSAFTVSIPLDSPAQAQAAASAAPPPRRGNALVLCQEMASANVLEEALAYAGWDAHSVTSVPAAEAWLRMNQPAFLIVTGEYSLDAMTTLRAVQPLNVVWITRTGPHRPIARALGVLEVTEFSHTAIFACIEQAAGGVPAEERRVEPDIVSEEVAADPAVQGLRILVAEDNPLNQTLVIEQLTTLGCLPILVGDGRQALAVLAQNEVDLVLTDIHMPIMDGYALIEALRQTHPQLPVLAFSAVTGAEQVDEWRRRGFANYITKPASLKQLEKGLLSLGLRATARGDRAGGAAVPEAPVEPSLTNLVADRITEAPTEPLLDLPSEPVPEPAPAQQPPDTAPTLDPADKARFMHMLKDHLTSDLPKLAAIIEREDKRGLREWAHGAAGAFLVVQEPGFAAQCRELQYLCDAHPDWTAELATHAVALHDSLRSHFALDATAP